MTKRDYCESLGVDMSVSILTRKANFAIISVHHPVLTSVSAGLFNGVN